MQAEGFWRRPEGRFIATYLVLVVVAFTVVALKPVDRSVVAPYTELVARASGACLQLMGEDVTIDGCNLRSPRFAVTIYNGCNGLITSLIFTAGVLAFPASWRSRLVGVALGLLAIQLINLVRILSLFYIGALAPDLFSQAHVFVWQSIVILSGVALWVVWARWASSRRPPSTDR